jgi:arylsulfatase A-like enzyme
MGIMSRFGRALPWGIVIATAIIAFGAYSVNRRRPSLNVVLMSIDSLRPDHLHCYGYPRETSPAIDALAAEGVVFRTAISTTSWTLPAHAALLTGLPDSVHGCTDNGKKLADERTTLAELFRQAGYRTAGVASGPYLAPVFGLSQGFDIYGNCSSMSDEAWSGGTQTPQNLIDWNTRSHSSVTSPCLLAKAQTFLESVGRRPFFLFLHWWDVHYDYEPPSPYDSMFDPGYRGWVTGKNVIEDDRINDTMTQADKDHLVALYDGEIAWTDHHVGLVIEALKRLGLWENTIVVITSDHGEEFFEHGGKGHQRTLFDEVVKIPMIMRWPTCPKGRVVDGQVRIIDLFPTLVEMTGIPGPPDSRRYRFGHDLAPFADAAAVSPEFPAECELRVFATDTDFAALRVVEPSGVYKAFEIFGAKKGRFFWNLLTDPNEQHPDPADQRARQAFERLGDLRSTFSEIGFALEGSTKGGELPEELKNALRANGYLK